MRTVSLTINGRKVQAEVEPRRNLADFLREDQFLTGTHIGCEHGVCGACTVLIDGSPARSCITYAVACDGAEVRTIEGLEKDPVMARLREAFSEHHGLQCGYCTPGMLISARDIVTRLPQADEKRIRLELSGNLCRCTGYVGIVAAVRSVMAQGGESESHSTRARTRLGPVGAHPPSTAQNESRSTTTRPSPLTRLAAERLATLSPHGGETVGPSAAKGRGEGLARPPESITQEQWAAVESSGVELLESFTVPCSQVETWRLLADLDTVARCIPGARLTMPLQNGRAQGEMHVKLGPIVSAFAGIVEIEREETAFRGVVRGAGRDSRSASSGRAIVVYTVKPLSETSSQVDLSVKFLLTGALAQFSRSGLVKDVADHLTRTFARNLAARLAGAPSAQSEQQVLDAGTLARAALWGRIVRFFRNLLRS
jgi:aerobic carbon-monoxide dehydrogenase small subunit